ncbi:MAG: FliH/SctL family protein [Granulosicoccus sp.]
MFRVLSADEAKKVVRWKAPDIGKSTVTVPNTGHVSKSEALPAGLPVTPVFRKQEPAADPQGPASANAMHATVAVDDNVYKPASGKGMMRDAKAHKLRNEVHLPNPTPDMLQASYDDGYARGFAKGSASLHDTTTAELKSIVDSLGQAIKSYSHEPLENEVLAMSLKIAELLVQRELSTDQSAVRRFIQLGLQQLPGNSSNEKRVYLNPLQAALVRELFAQNEEVRIEDDPLLERGQCRIESGASVVNAGVEDWLLALAAQMGVVTNPDSTVRSL